MNIFFIKFFMIFSNLNIISSILLILLLPNLLLLSLAICLVKNNNLQDKPNAISINIAYIN